MANFYFCLKLAHIHIELFELIYKQQFKSAAKHNASHEQEPTSASWMLEKQAGGVLIALQWNSKKTNL